MEERPELFENLERKNEDKQKHELCSKLTNKLNRSIMTLVNESENEGEFKTSPLKPKGKIRASTIVGTPNIMEFNTVEAEN